MSRDKQGGKADRTDSETEAGIFSRPSNSVVFAWCLNPSKKDQRRDESGGSKRVDQESSPRLMHDQLPILRTTHSSGQRSAVALVCELFVQRVNSHRN